MKFRNPLVSLCQSLMPRVNTLRLIGRHEEAVHFIHLIAIQPFPPFLHAPIPYGGRSIRERYKIKVESVHIGPSLVRCVVSPVFWCHMRSGGPMAIEIFIGFEGETATSYRSTSYFCLLFLAVSLLKNSWLNFLSGLSLSRHRSAARGDRGEA